MSKESRIELTGLDSIFGWHYAETLYFCKDLDADRLYHALTDALAYFPVLAGRLQTTDGGTFVALNNEGVAFDICDSNDPLPHFGPDAFPLHPGDFVIQFPHFMNIPPADVPLFSARVTRLEDGWQVLGISFNHRIIDGSALFVFMQQWANIYNGLSCRRPMLDRSWVGRLAEKFPARREVEEVASNSPLDLLKAGIAEADFSGVGLTQSEISRLKVAMAASCGAGVSFNDYLHALIFKVFALSSAEPEDKTAEVNTLQDLRRIKELGLPFDYFGNATIYRSASMTYGQLREINLSDLAAWFSAAFEVNTDDVLQEISYYQSLYANQTSVPPRLNGGIFINNCLTLSNTNFNFGDAIVWGEIVLRSPFAGNMVVLLGNRQSGISIRLAIAKELMELFRRNWHELLRQSLQ